MDFRRRRVAVITRRMIRDGFIFIADQTGALMARLRQIAAVTVNSR